ncbi:MAG: TIGR01777 family oxidoreductase [Acidimicrobiales bacterium]
MRVGVTGSSGFIGSALVRALADRGDEIVRFVRPGSPASGKTIRWDPSRGLVDEGDLAHVGGFDAVVHLAGAGIADKRWTSSRKKEIASSRSLSTSLLVRTLSTAQSGTAFLASGSAVGFYGNRGDESLDETSRPGTGFLANVCQDWEAEAVQLTDAGCDVGLLRTGIVMGTTGGALAKQLPLFRWGLGGRLASGRQWLSPISLRDNIGALLWIIDHRLSGPINLVAPEPITNRDFTKVLAHQLRRPAIATVPAPALRLVLGRELTDEAVLASQRVTPHVLMESGFAFHDPNFAAIARNLLG